MAPLPDLRTSVRDESPLADTKVLVRGGPDTVAKLLAHAARVRRAFVLDGSPVLGISVFCALDDVCPASLDAVLAQKLGTYQWVHLVSAGAVREAGFTLLPTFLRQHYTLVLPDFDAIEPLMRMLDSVERDPRYRQGQPRTKRRPR